MIVLKFVYEIIDFFNSHSIQIRIYLFALIVASFATIMRNEKEPLNIGDDNNEF